MPTRETLEAHVRAHPDDPVGWQVFADWLLEQGDPRGEAILLYQRLHTETLPPEVRQPLWARYDALCRVDGVPRHDALRDVEWRFGFVHSATFVGQHAPVAFAVLCDDSAGWLLTEARFRRVGEAELGALAHCAALQTLGVLDVGSQRMGDGALHALCSTHRLGHLAELHLADNELGAASVEPFVQTPLSRLRVLDLSDNHWDAVAVRHLVERAPPQLASLKLMNNPLGDAGAEALAAWPHGRLTHLDLDRTGLTDEGGCALAASPVLDTVQTLDLRRNRLTDATLDALGGVRMPALRKLLLKTNRHTDAGIRRLERSPWFGQLVEISVSGRRATGDALEYLRRSPRRSARLVVG